MKSIRLSLIVYFLVLLTGALGAVSWLSYRMTEQALYARRDDSQARIHTQCEKSSDALRDDLDRRILRQAHTMVGVSQSMKVHAEGQLFLFGMLGAEAMPGGHLNAAMFCYQGTKDDIAKEIYQSQPLSTQIQNGDHLVAAEDGNHAQEYFQTYRSNGSPMERSESMGDQSFTLDGNLREQLVVHTEHYDDVEMQHGVKVRRVTVKVNVPGSGVMHMPWSFNPSFKLGVVPPNIFFPKGPAIVSPPQKGKGAAKGKGPAVAAAPPNRPPTVFTSKTPFIFIQYASDVSSTDAKIIYLRKQRDEHIAQLESSVGRELKQLRERMIWIGLAALAAVWLGGYFMIRLGLAPLSKMSEAVSQVSVKNFHLPLQIEKLPAELRPIAERLVELLEHLQNAFAREKQAAADISHELRTPLAALMTTLEVGLKKSRSPDEYREILEDCLGSGQHMYELVERLLTLARLDAGVVQYRAESTDVTELAMQCADMIRPLAKARGIALRLNLPDQAVTTETDATKLREVLINLLHNAVEYNKADGSIDFSVELIDGKVRLEVHDTGIGIKPEALGRIFERFFRADPSRHADTPHAGLGLAIVKSFVDLMGGTIRVESSDAGTAFIVELPFIASIHDLNTAVQEIPALVQR